MFGRKREGEIREDRSGPGSFRENNRSLFVGGLLNVARLEATVRQQFSEFGELHELRVIPDKLIGFVEFKWRSAAEFAKEAMDNQDLGAGEQLNVRWANPDPNPAVVRRKQKEYEQMLAFAVRQRQQRDEHARHEQQEEAGRAAGAADVVAPPDVVENSDDLQALLAAKKAALLARLSKKRGAQDGGESAPKRAASGLALGYGSDSD